jgi:hypothetical protein
MKNLNSFIEFLEDILTKLKDDSVYSNEEIVDQIYSMIEELQED